MLIKICTMTCKKCAIPSLHRDSLPAKVPGPCPVLVSGNTTSPYCRAVSIQAGSPTSRFITKPNNKNARMLTAKAKYALKPGFSLRAVTRKFCYILNNTFSIGIMPQMLTRTIKGTFLSRFLQVPAF